MSADQMQIVSLPSHFSQTQLTGLKEIIDQHLQDGQQLQLDAANIEKMDGAAVQFMVAISQSANADKDNPKALIINTNEVLMNALGDMGVLDMVSLKA